MIEEEGLALRGTFVINPEGQIKVCEIHDNGIGRDARSCCARCRPRSTWRRTRVSMPGEVEGGEATLKPSLDLVGKI
jgi:alkyl hydroperoxide reductase subunit AhpC